MALKPFIKNGRVIPNAWVDSGPAEQEEHYTEITPADFDFPCSDTFRGYYFERYGRGDPGSGQSEVITLAAIPNRGLTAENMTALDRLDRMQGQLVALRDTVQELQKGRKKVITSGKL